MANCQNWRANMTEMQRTCWENFVFNPPYGTGLSLDEQAVDGYVVHVMLTGIEALRTGTMACLADGLRSQDIGAQDVLAVARDLDNRGDFFAIPTEQEYELIEARSMARVEEMLKGKRWESTDHGNGIISARLVDE